MKKGLQLVILIVVLFVFKPVFAQKAPASVATSTVKLSSATDSLQYILGAYLGQYIVSNGFTVTNPALFKRGLDDAMIGKQTTVHPDSLQPMINKYQLVYAAERGKQQETAMFELVKKAPGLGVLPSGVCYNIMKAGTGKRPQLMDSVQLHLKGFFPDGRLFEDTYPKNTPYRTSPNGVIAGIREILQIMPAGSIWRVYIPSSLAFGEKGVTGLIPPYTALIYEVELLTVTEMPQK